MTKHCKRPMLSAWISVLALVLVLVSPASAQSNKGTIVGTVTDPSGAVVSGATVTVTNVNTNAERTVMTGDDGTYTVPLLDIGNYKVAVSAPGFQTVTRENITLQISDRLPVDVELQVGSGAGETVTVTAEAPIIQTESSERGSVITGREVTELPLSGRNFTQLATLTPGVSRVTIGTLSDARANNNGDPNAGGQGPGGGDPRGSTESARFARSGGAVLSANGQRPTNNNFSVDGVDNNEPQFGTIGVFVNPDAIAEFRVTTSVPPAELGRAGGAVINTSFKSGTNEFHGSLYYYGQNSALNAYHPILKRNRNEAQANGATVLPTKAVQQIHEFGGTIGGPIFRDRTFFFFDYLGGRNNLPTPLASTVPSAAVRAGNFSEYARAILDPRTGQPFPGNIVPQNRLSPNARAFFNLFPLPTVNILNPDQFNNNFFAQRDVREEIDNFDIKIDHRLSANNSLSGRYSYQDNANVRGSFFEQVPAGFGAGNEVNNTRQVVITDTHSFSPTVLNDFRFGFTKIDIGILNCGIGGACGISESFSSDLGIPNTNDGSFEQSGSILVGGFGNGFVEFAGDGGPFIVNSKNPYFADTLTVIKGNHTWKVGGEMRLRYLETIDGGRTGGLKGNLSYADNGPATGANPNCPPGSGTPAACFVDSNGIPFGGTGNALANILLGVPALQTFRGSVPGGAFNLRSQEYGLFIQDDWKVSDRLTLNLGLRYDLFPSATEADGRLGNFSIDERRVLLADGGGDRLIETDKNNFGPRIGFAYAIGPEKTMVVRGGYGLLYTLDATDRPPLVQNPPFTNSVGFNQAFDASTPRSVFNLDTGPPDVPTVDPNNIPQAVRVFYADPEQKIASVHQFNLGIQWQFTQDLALDIGYVGNRSRNLLATRDIGGGGTAQARNTLGQFIAASAYENRASAQYDALQVQLQKRLSHNVQGQISYTWSHNIDDSTGVFAGIGEGRGSIGGPQNPFCLRCERGNSSLDVRHLLNASAIVDVPFGKGQRFFSSNATADKIIGGIQLNFIVTGRSGYPFTVVDGNNGSRRATQIGDPFQNVPAGRFLNPAAFSGGENVVVNDAGTVIAFGSLGRNTFRGPSFFRTDMSLFKNTGITERIKTQIGIEFFNLFNQATFTVPNNNFRDVGSFGRFDAALPGRVIQYRAKILF
ncbi:MAG TPA: TonB-dependent receptor [Blastocatellia bacterium]|nr:TonB-dependent receptor [Blastocatellia bacterium]